MKPSDRLGRATNALRGKKDSQIFGKIGALLIGVGIGVGVGLLIAPTSGEETRGDIADKVSDFGDRLGDRVCERNGKKAKAATGTHGEWR
jgi:gas vesicle protein